MISWFRRRAQDRRTAIDFYGAIVARARQPAFFGSAGVSDTPEGRASVIILLLFPVLERLHAEGPRAQRIARLVSETFVTDIDDCLREMGVGDMSVPKKVKRAAQALGERCSAYRAAALGGEPVPALAAELSATIPGLENDKVKAAVLARHTLAARSAVVAAPLDALLAGSVAFPDLAVDRVTAA